MLFYLIAFVGIGFAIAKFVDDKKVALGLIVGLALLWGASHRSIWGFVTLGELLLGYVLNDVLIRKNDSKTAPVQAEANKPAEQDLSSELKKIIDDYAEKLVNSASSVAVAKEYVLAAPNSKLTINETRNVAFRIGQATLALTVVYSNGLIAGETRKHLVAGFVLSGLERIYESPFIAEDAADLCFETESFIDQLLTLKFSSDDLGVIRSLGKHVTNQTNEERVSGCSNIVLKSATDQMESSKIFELLKEHVTK